MAGNASRENGLKGGRPLASATLKAQLMREEITTAVHNEFKELYEPQIAKAKEGDLAAFNSLMGMTISKPPTVNENHEVVDYKLADSDLNQIADGITELQKEGKYPSGPRT